MAWNFFASSLRFSVMSLTGNINLVTKVYFPREIFPFSAVLVSLVDFAVGAVVLVGLMVYYHIAPGWRAPVPAGGHPRPRRLHRGVALLLAMGNLFYRDVKYLFEVVHHRLDVRDLGRLPGRAASAAGSARCCVLNPMTPIIDAYRAVLLHGRAAGPVAVRADGRGLSLVLLAVGWVLLPPRRVPVRGEHLMSRPAVVFDGVWKKFRRGERHDSLRDLIPALRSAG